MSSAWSVLAFTDSNITGNAATATYAGNAGYTYKLYADSTLLTSPGNKYLSFGSAISPSTSGIFPGGDNSNAFLSINRHSGNYDSQLGFSSNGNLYYRSFSNEAINITKDILGEEVEVLETYFGDFGPDKKPLHYLAKSLEYLAEADIAYFVPGWENARGCKIEYLCAVEYGIDRIE